MPDILDGQEEYPEVENGVAFDEADDGRTDT